MKRTAILIAALAALLLATAAHAAFPGRNGEVVYGYDGYNDNYDGEDAFKAERGIYAESRWQTRQLFGCTEVVPYSQQSSCDRQALSDPTVSPDGALVAFDAGASLGLVGIDGRGFRLLPAQTADDGQPAFAPAGTQLVFAGAGGGLWIRDPADDTSRQLVPRASRPAWSTRDWIAFERSGAIYRARPDGSRLRRLTREGSSPSWSPDGRQLAFARSPHYRHHQIVQPGGIFVMGADGSHRRRLPRQARGERRPSDLAWSPDGRRLLAFDGAVISVDLSGHMRHAFGLENYVGAESVDQINGIDWRPLPD